MNIRPCYTRDVFSSLCCEEAALNAAEVDRLTRERDELRAKLDAAENRPEGAGGSRKENGSADSPTLDQEAVGDILGAFAVDNKLIAAIDAIMALAPAAEGWPEWLGTRVDPADFEVTRNADGDICLDGEFYTAEDDPSHIREWYSHAVRGKAHCEAVARFIESEQAKRDDETSLADSATGDEDQRVEEQAKALYETVQPNTAVAWSDQLRGVKESHIQDVRKMLDAGWTPPSNPVKV